MMVKQLKLATLIRLDSTQTQQKHTEQFNFDLVNNVKINQVKAFHIPTVASYSHVHVQTGMARNAIHLSKQIDK